MRFRTAPYGARGAQRNPIERRTPVQIGTVEILWRYPVKSMRGEGLSEAFIGFYAAVLVEGRVRPGDAIEVLT
jgi:uncharacterized protein YcbX